MTGKIIQGVRGVHDIIEDDVLYWHALERSLKAVLDQYGYREWRLPILEQNELFVRAIGQATEVVSKEMYTLPSSGALLALRPEGTAGCVRAGIEHGLFREGVRRVWYQGPMFRRERPQKGRYRQFHQLGVEIFGASDLAADLELLCVSRTILAALELNGVARLELNYMGSAASRNAYGRALQSYFMPYLSELSPSLQTTILKNPLRSLDSKAAEIVPYLAQAPRLSSFLSDEERTEFEQLQAHLKGLGIKYTWNEQLVRGLDYYNGLVFEWVTDELGSQSAICGGGRYDGLVSELGGRPTAAAGFAMGLERLLLLWRQHKNHHLSGPEVVYFVSEPTSEIRLHAFQIAETLRKQLNLPIVMHCGTGSFKAQIKRAAQHNTQIVLILGEQEYHSGTLSCRYYRQEKIYGGQANEQLNLPISELVEWLRRSWPRDIEKG